MSTVKNKFIAALEITLTKLNQSGASVGQLVRWTGSQWSPYTFEAKDLPLDTAAARNTAVGSTVQEWIDRIYEESLSEKPTYNANGTISLVEFFTSASQVTANRSAQVSLTYDAQLQPATETWTFYSLTNGTTILKTVTIAYTFVAGQLTNKTQVTT